jgi:type IV pilus assembly protein PilV
VLVRLPFPQPIALRANSMRSSKLLTPGMNQQHGSALIEVLVSILIFAMGILGILGLQTNTVGVAADARYRTEAAALADEYVALMSIANPANLGDYKTGGTAFSAWRDVRVKPTGANAALAPVALPNASVTVDLPAVIDLDDGNQATITVRWRGASAENDSTHITKTTIPPARPSEGIL